MPEAKKMNRVIFKLSILLRVILRIRFVGDLSHVQYSPKDPCCSLASLSKWVERSDDRKYVCVRRLAVSKRHNICSRSSSLATSSTCNHFRRLVDTIPRAPRASLFQILLAPSSNPCTSPTFPQRLLCGRDAR